MKRKAIKAKATGKKETDVIPLSVIVAPAQPGHGKPGGKPGPGRPKGSMNQSTRMARDFARGLIESASYRKKLAADFRARKVHPSVEVLMWHYAAGKPKEVVEVDGLSGLADLLQAALVGRSVGPGEDGE